jgi:gamma-glutamylcyclotransferase (GGCT)/AIG2-like uncharacterized protein YtfP
VIYFAYGANLNLQGMRYRCPQATPLMPYTLKDWRLSFSGVATIQPEPGSSVDGALWTITDDCEKSLDTFEGFPTLYRKHHVQTADHNIMFYIMNHDEPGEPSLGYLMTIAEGYQDWALPLDNLWNAVRTTQEEQYDLQWSTRSKRGKNGRDYASMVRVEPGHGLRDSDYLGDAYPYPNPIQRFV